MSASTVVDGDPEVCRRVACDLRLLHDQLVAAADGLVGVRAAASRAWRGHAADAFATRTAQHARRLDELAPLVGGFAADLAGLADALDAICSEMARAIAVATGAGIPVRPGSIPERGEFLLEPAQEEAHDHALAIVARARAREAEVQAAWPGALEPLTGFVWDPEPAGSLQGTAGPLDRLNGILLAPGNLPDLPRGLRLPGAIGNFKILADSMAKQQSRDRGRTDLSRREVALRGLLRGGLNIAGGVVGAVTAGSGGGVKAILVGEVKGRKLGDRSADHLLEVLDAVS